MSSLLPPNSTSFERAFDTALDARFGMIDPTAVTRAWYPQLCAAPVLPSLAAALSVDVWDRTWPLRVRRAAVAAAPLVHRIKGTHGAIRMALAALEARVVITDWWQAGLVPGTFRVRVFATTRWVAGQPALSPERIEAMRAAVIASAPVSRPFELELGIEVGGSIAAAASASAPLRRNIATIAPSPNRHVAGDLGAAACARTPLRASVQRIRAEAARAVAGTLAAGLSLGGRLRILPLQLRCAP
jgi:phage tail P2-like protein